MLGGITASTHAAAHVAAVTVVTAAEYCREPGGSGCAAACLRRCARTCMYMLLVATCINACVRWMMPFGMQPARYVFKRLV